MNPTKRITDPSFRYTDSASTDLKKTFARIRREQRDIKLAQEEQAAREAQNVRPIKTVRKA